MNVITEIRVTNLSAEIATRFGGKTSVALDLPIDFALRLSKDVLSLSILGKIKVEGILGFGLPYTPTNDAVFAEYETPLTVDNRTIFYDAQVTVDGFGLPFNRLQVKGKDEKSKEWEIELSRSADHWVELSQQIKTNDLDYGSFVMLDSAIIGNWALPAYEGDYTNPNTGQRPYYWPLVDYGGWCDQTEPPQGAEGRFKAVAVEDFRPWLSFVYILRAGFCKFGWTLESILFDIDDVRRLWVYALRPDYFIASNRGGRIIGRNYAQFNWTPSIVNSDFLRFTDLAFGLTGTFISQAGNFYCGIRNVTGVALKYKFYLKSDFFNDRPLPFTAFFAVMELGQDGTEYNFTGEQLSTEPYQVDFAANEKKNVTFEETVVLKPGQIAAIHINVLPSSGFKSEPGLFFSVTQVNDCLFTQDIVKVADCVSDDMSILDWLKAFIHLVNGRLTTDWETKTVTIYPNKTSNLWSGTAPGFLLRESPIVDLEEFVVPDSIKIKPVRPNLKRFTRFEFKKSTDKYIESLNLLEPAHSRTLLNSVEFPDGIESVANPFIEPTLEGQPNGIASGASNRNPRPFIPRLWDNESGNRSFNIGPRLLYAYGVVQQINPAPINAANEFTTFFFNNPPNPGGTGAIGEFGYASNLPTWELTPAPTVKPYFVFGSTGVDLFSIFYLGYTQDNRNGNTVDLLLKMKMKDYVGFDFRSFYRFRYRGLPIVAPMQSIRDFKSGTPDVPTPVTFFVEPSETNCCDLPCGCRFQTCEYYQDLGPNVRQSTLNSWLVSSFIVDGIELLTAPVALGYIDIIDIGGKPYVTNLVDVLNSIGAPYFSFSYSTRLHPEKGLRYFKIKRLSCIPFRITITVGGNDGYYYTQDEQKQAIFQAGFDDLGYGSTFTGVPENCIITTEY
jgi:hypothetical protein